MKNNWMRKIAVWSCIFIRYSKSLSFNLLFLSKKLSEDARKVFESISGDFMVDFDEAGSIGKRYRRQDEIGTPYCITFDFDSLEDNSVTIRDRDTMEQIRLPIGELNNFLQEKIRF